MKRRSVSTQIAEQEKQLHSDSKFRRWCKGMKENYPFLIFLFPAVLVVFLFNYLPIYGILIAFQDFMPGDDIFSEYTIWVGFENFERSTHSYENGKCSCGAENGFAGVSTWTEGSLTPVTREDTEDSMKITSANENGDWWKVKLELPRTVENGKSYEAKFIFTSNVCGTIKFHVGDATFLNGNELNVQPGENTFIVRFTAGADDYSCLELGGLGQFELNFTEITVAEEKMESVPETGDATNMILWVGIMAAAGMATCVMVGKKRAIF